MTGLLFVVGAEHMKDKIDPSFHYGFLQVFEAYLIECTRVCNATFMFDIVSIIRQK